MMGSDFSDADHLVRHINSRCREGDVVNAEGFYLRPGEALLSVNWLEAFDGDKQFQLAEVRRLFRRELKSSHRFAELEIGTLRKKILEMCKAFRIVHDPHDAKDNFDADPSHVGLEGLPPRKDLPESDLEAEARAEAVGDLIASCVIALHPAKPEK